MYRFPYLPFFALAVVMLAANTARGETLTASERALFENKIRPVLVKHCYECHAAGAKELGGKLLLDTRADSRAGGESGAAIVPGDPSKSLLIQAMQYDGLEMPPSKPLPQRIINDFVLWVKRGAPDPRIKDAKEATKGKQQTEAPTTLWSLRPRSAPPLPEVKNKDWPRDPLDRFVLAKMEANGLSPNTDADARALYRRLAIDLIGLPPTAYELEAFERAYEADPAGTLELAVDDFLMRPQFGERWGRHWLDVARFGESNGNDGLGRNPTFPHAWRYRDYVIAAFNKDKPYDRFLREQIAGDLLPSENDEQRDQNLVATGFLAMAAKPAKAMNNNFEMDVVADQIDVVGTGIMGLSVACARCHDHKFDPVPTRDYYALAGIFTSSETMWGVAANERLTAPVTDLHVLKAAAKVKPPKDFVETVLVLESNTGKPKPIPKPKWPIGTPLAMGVRDIKKPADGKINVKGDAKKLGKAVPRGFLSSVPDFNLKVDSKQSGRLQLARWLTHKEHPLTARVMVNRVWQHMFGDGIVRTPDDFGVYGERPTHPHLLDHLANRFVEGGWSLKSLIRAIALSRTYRLSSHASDDLLDSDPENILLTHHKRRRLDAESLRDSMLRASGQLNLAPADGSIIRHRDILVNLAGNLHQPSRHRSVYLCYLRSALPPELMAFDLPDFTSVLGKRNVSTVPGQSLHLLNSPFVVQQAVKFAELVVKETADEQGRVEFAYRRAFNRSPSEVELQGAIKLLHSTRAALQSDKQDKTESIAWTGFCQALLMTNEFRYVD